MWYLLHWMLTLSSLPYLPALYTVSPTPWGTGEHVPPLLQMAGLGGTVSRGTANEKLTKLFWPSRNRSQKRLIVLLEPKSGGARPKKIFRRKRRIGAPFSFRTGAPIFKFVPTPLFVYKTNFLALRLFKIYTYTQIYNSPDFQNSYCGKYTRVDLYRRIAFWCCRWRTRTGDEEGARRWRHPNNCWNTLVNFDNDVLTNSTNPANEQGFSVFILNSAFSSALFCVYITLYPVVMTTEIWYCWHFTVDNNSYLPCLLPLLLLLVIITG